jgi:hypothetical protein
MDGATDEEIYYRDSDNLKAAASVMNYNLRARRDLENAATHLSRARPNLQSRNR